MNGKREFGDYQTPFDFASQICDLLIKERGIHPSAVIEPTCGIGAFLRASLRFNASEFYGIEIDPEHCNACRADIDDKRVTIINENFFSFDTKKLVKDPSHVLVIGNPPWVNNSTLSALDSSNIPRKYNCKGLKGLDALTGASNFDICEYMILQLVREYANMNATIAMLCKTTVGRNVFMEMRRANIHFSSCEIFTFDAKKVFGVNASVCLLLIRSCAGAIAAERCEVYELDAPNTVISTIDSMNGRFFSNADTRSVDIDGRSCFEWRQGVKHDCSKVMELTVRDGRMINGENTPVSIEETLVYPLIKSSMFKTPIVDRFSKRVIVTQQKPRGETDYIRDVAPLTWNYLNDHIDAFYKRKSSIYRGAPKFSMFGVGDYSFSRYKVGVSGFYKKPLFCVLYSEDGKPVMTDDTCYFICFPSYCTAYVAMLYLNSPFVQEYLSGVAFIDAKRPYTKKVLERIDFGKLIDIVCFDDLFRTEKRLGLKAYLTPEMYHQFSDLPGSAQRSFAI